MSRRRAADLPAMDWPVLGRSAAGLLPCLPLPRLPRPAGAARDARGPGARRCRSAADRYRDGPAAGRAAAHRDDDQAPRLAPGGERAVLAGWQDQPCQPCWPPETSQAPGGRVMDALRSPVPVPAVSATWNIASATFHGGRAPLTLIVTSSWAGGPGAGEGGADGRTAAGVVTGAAGLA